LAVGRLAVSVAHRLSTLRNATRILVLEQGRAVGLGTHQELLADCPTYRRLWEAQGGYVELAFETEPSRHSTERGSAGSNSIA
jgi:ABC-type transport system involved in cytochrome bd biosynthesis fused ATPase/permease subunit